MSADAPISAADIRRALLKRYPTPGWRVFFEVANATGSRGERRIDALALGIWPSTGHEIIGIEIKVSKSDFARELADPSKSQALMRYCTRWQIACPAGLLSADDLPANWGLISLRAAGVFSVVKKPPLLKPEGLDAGFMMAILRGERDPDQELVAKLVAEQAEALNTRFEERVSREAARRSGDLARGQKTAIEIGEKLKAIVGTSFLTWEFDVEALAAAYLFLKQTGLHTADAWKGLGKLRPALEQAQALLTKVETHPEFAALRAAIDGARPKQERVEAA